MHAPDIPLSKYLALVQLQLDAVMFLVAELPAQL